MTDSPLLRGLLLQELQDMIMDGQHETTAASLLLSATHGMAPSTLPPLGDTFVQTLNSRLEAKAVILSDFLQMPIEEFMTLEEKAQKLEAEEVALQREVNALSVEYVTVTENNVHAYQNLLQTVLEDVQRLLEKRTDIVEATQDHIEARAKLMLARYEVSTYNKWTVPALEVILSRLQSSVLDLTSSESRLRKGRAI